MKSQQTKQRLEKEEAITTAVKLARENNPYLMALYLAFVPGRMVHGDPKFSYDKYGNRVLTETLKEVLA